MPLKIQWKRRLVYVSLWKKRNQKTSYSVILRVRFNRFSLAIINTFAQYASVNFWTELTLGKISAASCQIFFKFSRFSWSIFEVRTWDVTLLIIFFTWKTTTTNLKSCIELNKVTNTRNLVGKKLPDISEFSWKNREFKYLQKLNEVYSHGI